MRLNNETGYRDEDLRAFLLAGLRAMGSTGQHKTVRVVHTRPRKYGYTGETATNPLTGATFPIYGYVGRGEDTYVTGCAQIGRSRKIEGCYATMRIPAPPAALDMAQIARVWMHEIMHLQGVRHRDMTPAQRSCEGPLPEWATGLEIRVAEETTKPSREERMAELVASREEHARTMLDTWEKKAKRAAAVAKKWRDKVRGYEQRAAAKKRDR